jgi:hypothetical protein
MRFHTVLATLFAVSSFALVGCAAEAQDAEDVAQATSPIRSVTNLDEASPRKTAKDFAVRQDLANVQSSAIAKRPLADYRFDRVRMEAVPSAAPAIADGHFDRADMDLAERSGLVDGEKHALVAPTQKDIPKAGGGIQIFGDKPESDKLTE